MNKIKKEVEVISGYKAVLRNRAHFYGQYYSEDDWSVTAVGANILDLTKNLVKEIEERGGINVDGKDIYEVKFLIWEGKHIVLEEKEIPNYINKKHIDTHANIFDTIFQSNEYKDMVKRLIDAEAEKKKQTEQEEATRKENNERAELARLQNKYGNNS